MISTKLTALAMATVAALAMANPANAQLAYAIAGGGTTLISFNVAAPGTILSSVSLSGNIGTGLGLDAIDFRPSNGVLYGYNDADDALYTVNTGSGVLALSNNSFGTAGATAAFGTGLDFNPQIDRVRVGNDANENRVYNPNTNAAATNTTTPNPNTVFNLFYATAATPGGADVNAGVIPNIVENAYTNNLPGAAGQQFGIDYVQGTLVTIANNSGVLRTVGSLGLGTGVAQAVGFDIFTTLGGVNTAYALLDISNPNSTGTAQRLYTIDTITGLATDRGALGNTSSVYSLAIVTAVPEANTGALLGLGAGLLGMVGTALRRRAAK